MTNKKFSRGAVILKTQPIYAPNKFNRRLNLVNPKIHSSTKKNTVSWKINIPVKFWIFLLITIILFGIIWFVYGSSYFRINKIEISGEVNEVVKAEINKLYGLNILSYSTGDMSSRIKSAQSSIENVKILKGLPKTIRVEVLSRTPVIRWQHGENTDLIDGEGIFFRFLGNQLDGIMIENLPIVVDLNNQPTIEGNKIISKQFIVFVGKTSNYFKEHFPVTINRFEIGQSSFEVTLITNDGWKVIFDTTRQPEPQLEALKKIFEKFNKDIKDYIDLRVSGRAYFR